MSPSSASRKGGTDTFAQTFVAPPAATTLKDVSFRIQGSVVQALIGVGDTIGLDALLADMLAFVNAKEKTGDLPSDVAVQLRTRIARLRSDLGI